MSDKQIRLREHPIKKWEVSIMELEDAKNKRFKVTKRVPALSVSETLFFNSKKRALEKFNEWLH